MKNAKLTFLFLIAFSANGAMSAIARQSGTPVPDADADNTALNRRDASGTTLTPDDQAKGSKSDVEITRRIRRLLTEDHSLSTSAKNVKIITLKGNVTLRGTVASMQENDKVLKAAHQVAGAGIVNNELDVKKK